MSKKIVIIGGVAAGPKTACHLKRIMPSADITIIDQDSIISYGGCGIPYYVSGDVSDEKELCSTSFHMVRNEAFFQDAKGVKVLTSTRVTGINNSEKTVAVENLKSKDKDIITYDKLVITTGSQPNNLPIPGSDLEGVFKISDLHQAITIKKQLATGKVGKAVVIGGGAIGIEMAESFADLWGVETTIIEYLPQLLPNLTDPVFATMLARHLEKNKVKVLTGQSAKSFEADEKGRVAKVVTDNEIIDTDLVVMAVGVRPRDQLAKEAGLLVSPRGGIIVNNRLQTSDPDIYAAGDCIETTNLITGKKAFAPMGSLANRQGRVVGGNIAGLSATFNGIVGSFIMKAFEVAIGATGLTLEAARAEGFDAQAALTAQSDRAHFFPTQAILPTQMVFDRRTRKVLGVQCFGPMSDAVLARINSAAGLIAKGAIIEDFSNLETAYAPPFATALDVINATANVADNLASNRMRPISIKDFLTWIDNPEKNPDWVALDIRHPNEAGLFVEKFKDKWLAIPYNEIRNRYKELPDNKTLIIICDAGTRSYEIQCFLDSIDLKNNLVLGGGFNFIRRLGVDWWPVK
jgi:NADPH-dependent 2,4-dienoyl-CoA reductase/sulfur reductase-like enzyme/rhodanese-related sulfurtransferase